MSKNKKRVPKSKYAALITTLNTMHPIMNPWKLAGKVYDASDKDVAQHTLREWVVEHRNTIPSVNSTKTVDTGISPYSTSGRGVGFGDTVEKVEDGLTVQLVGSIGQDQRNMQKFVDLANIPSVDDLERGEIPNVKIDNYQEESPKFHDEGEYYRQLYNEDKARKAWIQNNPELANVPSRSLNYKSIEKTYVVMGCLHMPYHNKRMFDAALKLISDLRAYGKLNGLILNGDILDMNSISHHGKNKVGVPGMTLDREYQMARHEFDKLDKAAGPCEKVYMYGNHEMWYYTFMQDPNNFKLGEGAVMSPEEGLGLRRRGYKVYRDYKTAYHMLGDLEVIHGDYVSVHAAHTHVQKMKRNVMFAHTHRMGSYVEGKLQGYNIGWGGDSTAPVFNYMSRVMKETWRNGFAVVTVDEQGFSHVTQITWTNDSFYFGGKRYSA